MEQKNGKDSLKKSSDRTTTTTTTTTTATPTTPTNDIHSGKTKVSGVTDEFFTDTGTVFEKVTPEKKKTRRTPKRKPKKPAYQPYMLVDKAVCEFVATTIPFTLLIAVTGNRAYELTKEEKDTLTPLWDKVIQKHLPAIIGEYSEEASLISMIGMLLVTKSGILFSKPKTPENEANGLFKNG